MVLLTMTPSIVEALQSQEEQSFTHTQQFPGDAPLEKPAVGNPISHGQVVHLWKSQRREGQEYVSLETLLQGARVYVPPEPPAPEPSDEFKALMARLRRDEDQRIYERMANPPSRMDGFADLFPAASSFAGVHRPSRDEDLGDDEVTYKEVHRQLILILNVLVSIVGVAATLWILARWWSTPARLFLAMGGSLLVGIAEIGLYSGYIWHLSKAKTKDKRMKEVKEVVQTWVLGQDDKVEDTILIGEKEPEDDNGVRRRKEASKSGIGRI